MYEDGKPGEIFLVMAKEGSTISGLMDAFATSISMALQYGVPLEALVEKFSHVRFEPSGFTKNQEIPYAKSITDYIFRWMASKFLSAEHQEAVGIQRTDPSHTPVVASPGGSDQAAEQSSGAAVRVQSDAAPLPLLRQHHDAQRFVLPLRQLREHQRLQLTKLGRRPSLVIQRSVPVWARDEGSAGSASGVLRPVTVILRAFPWGIARRISPWRSFATTQSGRPG